MTSPAIRAARWVSLGFGVIIAVLCVGILVSVIQLGNTVDTQAKLLARRSVVLEVLDSDKTHQACVDTLRLAKDQALDEVISSALAHVGPDDFAVLATNYHEAVMSLAQLDVLCPPVVIPPK